MEDQWNSPSLLLGMAVFGLTSLGGFFGLVWKLATWKSHQEEINKKQDNKINRLESFQNKYEDLFQEIEVLRIHAEYTRRHIDALFEGRKVQGPPKDDKQSP